MARNASKQDGLRDDERVEFEDDISSSDDPDLAWLNNGFDEDAIRQSYKRDLERAINAPLRPRHWRPVDVEYTS